MHIFSLQAEDSKTKAILNGFWITSVLDDYGSTSSVLDIICGDFDNDGIDELVVSVDGGPSGAYSECFLNLSIKVLMP